MRMGKTRLLLAGALILSLESMAQQLSPSVLAVSGGTARTQTMILDWTLGESVVETHYATDRLYTQGFHQPMLQVTEQSAPASVGNGEPRFVVAPNPVTSHFTVTAGFARETPFQLRLTDLTGRQYLLPDLPATTESLQVDMSGFPAGTYLLHISKDNGSRLQSYKVIKSQ